MTVRAIGVLAALGLVACSREAPLPPKVEAARPEPAAAASNEIVLNEKMQQEVRIRTAPVTDRALPQVVQANGRLTVNETRTWHVGAITDGRVMRANVVPGDYVKRDQVLAGLHSHDIHEARAEYRRASQEATRLKTVLSYSQKQRDRMKRLYDLKAASLEQVEHAETELKNAQSALTNAETEVERTKVHLVEFLQVSLEGHTDSTGDAEHDDDLIPVKAPADGIILERKVTAGSVVKGGDDLFIVSDPGTLWMIAAVGEENVGKLRIGMVVKVKVQAYPDQTFTGRITKFGDQLDAETRTLPTRVELVNSGRRLRPEMYATAEIAVGAGVRAVLIPQAAVQQVNGQPVVFVRKAPDKFEVRVIETGRALDGMLEAARGLEPGDQVVVEGSYVLKSQLLKGSLAE